MKYINDKVKVSLEFNKNNIKWLRTKFDIKTNNDITDAIYEMISTYMEMD